MLINMKITYILMTLRNFISQSTGYFFVAALHISSLTAYAMSCENILTHTRVLPTKGSRIFSYRQDGLRVPAFGESENLLVQTELRLKRLLTDDEIRDLLPKILLVTGEKLEVVPERRGGWCFTANMKVLTPNGEVPISKLKIGDAVISIDLATGHAVTNRVRKTMVTQNQTIGTLTHQERPLEVTGSERFFTDGGKFTELAQIPESCNLFRVDLAQPKQLLSPVPRGIHRPSETPTTVYNLELIGEPRNFVVEGLLVHNAKTSS
jgi:hypothetical protein